MISPSEITVRRLRLRAGHRTLLALDDARLPIEKPLLVIHAPSGTGKSLLFRALCGYVPRGLAGEVDVALGSNDEAVYASALHRETFHVSRNFRYVAQSSANTFSPFRSLRRQMLDVRRTDGPRPEEIAGPLGVARLLADDVYSYEISTGQTQRLAFVRAVCSGGRVLFCDEITSGLDPDNEARMLDACRQAVADLGLRFVISSHRPVEGVDVEVCTLSPTTIVPIAKDAGPRPVAGQEIGS